MTVEWEKFKTKARGVAGKTAKVLGKAQMFATIATQAAAKATPLAKVGVAVSVAHMVSDLLRDGDPGKRGRSWHFVPLPRGGAALVKPLTEMVGDGWFYGRLGEQEIAYRESSLTKGEGFIYAQNDPTPVRAFVRARMLSNMGTHGILTTGSNGALTLQADKPPEVTPSSLVDALWRRLSPVISAGYTRVLMLDGPPGTGKTTLAETLARRVIDSRPGATSLRIQVSDLGTMQPSALDSLLNLLRVDVLLIDDLGCYPAHRGAGSGLCWLARRVCGRGRASHAHNPRSRPSGRDRGCGCAGPCQCGITLDGRTTRGDHRVMALPWSMRFNVAATAAAPAVFVLAVVIVVQSAGDGLTLGALVSVASGVAIAIWAYRCMRRLVPVALMMEGAKNLQVVLAERGVIVGPEKALEISAGLAAAVRAAREGDALVVWRHEIQRNGERHDPVTTPLPGQGAASRRSPQPVRGTPQ